MPLVKIQSSSYKRSCYIKCGFDTIGIVFEKIDPITYIINTDEIESVSPVVYPAEYVFLLGNNINDMKVKVSANEIASYKYITKSRDEFICNKLLDDCYLTNGVSQ